VQLVYRYVSGNVMAEAGDQLKVWEITREYTAQLCERMGPDARAGLAHFSSRLYFAYEYGSQNTVQLMTPDDSQYGPCKPI
jgi:hypothetical protein